nr:hypothetical protein [Richelia sinica]
MPTEEMGNIVENMCKSLIHRGPDDGGSWVDEEAGIALGHRRLSIVDLSPEGHQPMISADGRYVIVFNGEIYNFLELRKQLQSLGYSFRGHSDTEVMLSSFCQWGVLEATKRFNGMFAFALWDVKNGFYIWDAIASAKSHYTTAGVVILLYLLQN